MKKKTRPILWNVGFTPNKTTIIFPGTYALTATVNKDGHLEHKLTYSTLEDALKCARMDFESAKEYQKLKRKLERQKKSVKGIEFKLSRLEIMIGDDLPF